MSSYKKQLKTERQRLFAEMSTIRGRVDNHTATMADRSRFRDLDVEIRDIDNRLAIAKDDTLRNTYRSVDGRRMHRTEDDDRFTAYLRGRAPQPQFESRASLDSNALSTAPNDAGLSAGPTGYDAGYMIPQGSNQGPLSR